MKALKRRNFAPRRFTGFQDISARHWRCVNKLNFSAIRDRVDGVRTVTRSKLTHRIGLVIMRFWFLPHRYMPLQLHQNKVFHSNKTKPTNLISQLQHAIF
jgi:hypothetical protein